MQFHHPQSEAGATVLASEPSAKPKQAAQPWQALCLLARLHHIAADPDTQAHKQGLSPHADVPDSELLSAAKALGLKAKISRTAADRLSLAPPAYQLPAAGA